MRQYMFSLASRRNDKRQAGIIVGVFLGFATTISAITVPQAVGAQSLDPNLYDGGKARVNRSASLRSLTETVASASCRLHGAIETDMAQQQLTGAMEEFNAILAGLENGNAALGIPTPETRPRTIGSIQDTVSLWGPVASATSRLVQNSGTADDAATVRDSYADLFDQTVVLAADVSGQYSNPQELLQSDATVLNFAIRQRALASRISRAMCELATGTNDDETLAELAATVDLFERTLGALSNGFPDAGIAPPPNDAVKGSLAQTQTLWDQRRALIMAVLDGATPTEADVIETAALADQLSISMNNTITLYLIATPGKDGIYRVPLEAFARDELSNWLTEPALIDAIKAQNDLHAELSDDDVLALDQEWRAEASAGGGALITKLIEHPVSAWLRDQQAGTAGFVTEVFIMDNKGLNVAQSVETSDYWQGDEAKWQETYLVGPDALHISEVEFDDSTGFYQSQASLAIKDPATGAVIGAITFGINVQNLM